MSLKVTSLFTDGSGESVDQRLFSVTTRVVDEKQEILMSSFPYVHLFALIAGGFIVFMVNRKYNKMTSTEIILILVLFASLVILFTEPVVNLIKRLLS